MSDKKDEENMECIEVNCILITKFVLKMKFKLSEIKNFFEFLYKLYIHLNILNINKLSIFLGKFYFCARGSITDKVYEGLPDQEGIELKTIISIDNYNDDFIEKLYMNTNMHYYIEYKIHYIYFDNKNLQNDCEQIVDRIILVEQLINSSKKLLDAESNKNNHAFLKMSLSNYRSCNSLENKNWDDDNFKFLKELQKHSSEDFKKKIEYLKAKLNETEFGEKLCKILEENDDDEFQLEINI
jgi:hypothetical protein